MSTRKLNRRDFVKKTAQLGAALASSSFLGRVASAADNTYEYIVIGSGAGGGPVAANLARAGKRVLLLEAGGQYNPLTAIVPAFHGLSTEDKDMSWHFYVQHYSRNPERDWKYIPGKGVLYPRAGTLGGCTAHNAMFTLYPDNQDWDDLQRLTGDSTFHHHGMRDWFTRVESAGYLKRRTEGMRRGIRGWLNNEQTDPRLALKDRRLFAMAVAAAKESGLGGELIEKWLQQDGNFELDPNDWNYVMNKADGLFNIPKATKDGKRIGTRERILDTIRDYPRNLELKSGCLVTKLLFHPTIPNRVTGVEYLQGDHLYQADVSSSQAPAQPARREAFATAEVIVAGGAFNSPQLLQLSGIGDEAELGGFWRANGIRPRANLPGVGKNLQDRYEVAVVSKLDRKIRPIEKCTFGLGHDPCLDDWYRDPKKAIYGTNGAVITILRRSSPGKTSPDLAIFGVPGRFRGYFPGWSRDSLHADEFSWVILKGHTQNTAGYVRVTDKDPRKQPLIHFNYFDEGNGNSNDDLESVVDGVKFAKRINGHLSARTAIKHQMHPEPQYAGDAGTRDFVKNEAWGHHASCSNRMGPKNDPMAVVDSTFRVRGVENLRIVDASVFPRVPGLFIVAPLYMLAEKASHDILTGRIAPG